MKAFVALAVRLAIGEHVVRLEAVHAASGAKHTVTDTKIVSLSSFGIWRPHGEVPLRFSEPGPHFVNVRVDGQRIAAMVIHADDPDNAQSYKLRASDATGIKADETFLLPKRSIEAPPDVGLSDFSWV